MTRCPRCSARTLHEGAWRYCLACGRIEKPLTPAEADELRQYREANKGHAEKARP